MGVAMRIVVAEFLMDRFFAFSNKKHRFRRVVSGRINYNPTNDPFFY